MSGRLRRLLRFLVFVPAVVLGVMAYRRRWVCDDAFVEFRVVENWIAGFGPVFNIGERVEAYTSPAWVAVLTLWRGFGGPLELGAVVLGIVFAVAGLLAAQAGGAVLARRQRDEPRPRPRRARHTAAWKSTTRAASEYDSDDTADEPAPRLLPLGALVLAVLPAMWDFSTSGLETGLTFAWLGATFWMLVRALQRPGVNAWRDEDRPQRGSTRYGDRMRIDWKNEGEWQGIAVLAGLGPLVRHDLAIFSILFLVALLVCRNAETGRGFLSSGAFRLLFRAALLPLAYQLFRMGYFAALVSNPALAQEAGGASWDRGRIYASDFANTYRLWLPLMALLAAWGLGMRTFWQRRDRCAQAVMLAPLVGALLHALWVMRAGGDAMHARMLLPSLWGSMLPLTMVWVPAQWPRDWKAATPWSIPGVVLVWSLVCATGLRAPTERRGLGLHGITDERAHNVSEARRQNPIASADFERTAASQDGARLLQRVRAAQEGTLVASSNEGGAVHGPRVVLIDEPESPASSPSAQEETHVLSNSIPHSVRLVVGRWTVGLTAFVAGREVHVVDRLGKIDPIGARLRTSKRDSAGPGLSNDWIVGRFSDADPNAAEPPAAAAARRVLASPPLANLIHAVQDPLTIERFTENLRLAKPLHQLRIPADPVQAEHELCASPANAH